MDKMKTSFDKNVILSILTNNQFDIVQVNDLESLKSTIFVREEYPVIEDLIKTGSIDRIKAISNEKPSTEEYLDIMIFKDQNQKNYIVTVYDNSALEQDPQVIQIYLFQHNAS